MLAIPKIKREVDDAYRRWITTFPCLVKGRVDACSGDIDPDHSIPKSLGGSDRSCVPLCRYHHELANRRRWFEQRYAIIFRYEVAKYNRLYGIQHPKQILKQGRPRQKLIKPKNLIRAFAVLEPDTGTLTSYGNGGQFQYPIFYSEDEAKKWKAEMPYRRGRIVRCQIRIEGKG